MDMLTFIVAQGRMMVEVEAGAISARSDHQSL
jgi:hypothetical protein